MRTQMIVWDSSNLTLDISTEDVSTYLVVLKSEERNILF